MVYCCSVADIELNADVQRCLLTVSIDIAQGSAFDIAHEVTIEIYMLNIHM